MAISIRKKYSDHYLFPVLKLFSMKLIGFHIEPINIVYLPVWDSAQTMNLIEKNDLVSLTLFLCFRYLCLASEMLNIGDNISFSYVVFLNS